MINLIGIFIMLFIESLIILFTFRYYRNKKNLEIEKMQKQFIDMQNKIKKKNLKIKELQDEIERRNHKRL